MNLQDLGIESLDAEIDSKFLKALTLLAFAHVCKNSGAKPGDVLERIATKLESEYESLLSGSGSDLLLELGLVDADELLKVAKEKIRSRKDRYQSTIEKIVDKLAEGDRA